MATKGFYKQARKLNFGWSIIQDYLDQETAAPSLESLEQYVFDLEESDRLQAQWDSQQPEARIAVGERHAVSRFLR